MLWRMLNHVLAGSHAGSCSINGFRGWKRQWSGKDPRGLWQALSLKWCFDHTAELRAFKSRDWT